MPPPTANFRLLYSSCLFTKRFGTSAVGAVLSNSFCVVSRTNLPFRLIIDAPTSAEPPLRRERPAGFQKMSEASMHAPPVAAKPREIAQDPISLSANPCPPANAGNRTAAAEQSNDRVARRSSMTILLKDDPGAGRRSGDPVETAILQAVSSS